MVNTLTSAHTGMQSGIHVVERLLIVAFDWLVGFNRLRVNRFVKPQSSKQYYDSETLLCTTIARF